MTTKPGAAILAHAKARCEAELGDKAWDEDNVARHEFLASVLEYLDVSDGQMRAFAKNVKDAVRGKRERVNR